MKHSEHDEQVALCQYLDLKGLKYTAIVNSFFGNKNYGMIAKFKREGWNSGLPDMFIIIGNRAIFIELKTKDRKPKRGGKGGVSDEQQAWIDALNMTNVKAFVCYGFDEARYVVDREIKMIA